MTLFALSSEKGTWCPSQNKNPQTNSSGY